jgi:hypothetical protein
MLPRRPHSGAVCLYQTEIPRLYTFRTLSSSSRLFSHRFTSQIYFPCYLALPLNPKSSAFSILLRLDDLGRISLQGAPTPNFTACQHFFLCLFACVHLHLSLFLAPVLQLLYLRTRSVLRGWLDPPLTLPLVHIRLLDSVMLARFSEWCFFWSSLSQNMYYWDSECLLLFFELLQAGERM